MRRYLRFDMVLSFENSIPTPRFSSFCAIQNFQKTRLIVLWPLTGTANGLLAGGGIQRHMEVVPLTCLLILIYVSF